MGEENYHCVLACVLVTFMQRMSHHLLMKIVSIFAGTDSGLHCWQIWIFSYAYALNFINWDWDFANLVQSSIFICVNSK